MVNVDSIVELLAQDVVEAEEEIKLESLKGAANQGHMANLRAIIAYIHDLSGRISRSDFTPEEFGDEPDEEPEPPEELKVSKPKAPRVPKVVTPKEKEPSLLDKLLTPDDDPSKRSHAGPTVVVDNTDGTVRELTEDVH